MNYLLNSFSFQHFQTSEVNCLGKHICRNCIFSVDLQEYKMWLYFCCSYLCMTGFLKSWSAVLLIAKPYLMKHTNVLACNECVCVLRTHFPLHAHIYTNFCEETCDHSSSNYTKIVKLETADFTLNCTMSVHIIHSFSIPESKICCRTFGMVLFLCLYQCAGFSDNEELRSLYSLPSIIRMIKSRRVRWAGHVAQMGRRGMHVGYWWESQNERDH
jgi:hypothetical protein